MPIFWDQPGYNVGQHKIRLSRGPELSSGAFGNHFFKLRLNYGSVAIVNLLGGLSPSGGSKEGGEAALSAAYQNHHRSGTLENGYTADRI